MCRWFSGSFDVFVCLICFPGIQVLHQIYIPGVYNIQGRSSTDLFTHLFWIWTIQTRGTTSVRKRWYILDNKYLTPQQVYSEEEQSVSFELSQGRDKVSEEPITFSIEQGMNSKVPFVQEIVKDKQEEDLIFKKFDFSLVLLVRLMIDW